MPAFDLSISAWLGSEQENVPLEGEAAASTFSRKSASVCTLSSTKNPSSSLMQLIRPARPSDFAKPKQANI
jgi:hypothetical protein